MDSSRPRIGVLPTEILVKIFETVLDGLYTPWQRREYALCIFHVCHYWCDMVIIALKIWSLIHIAHNGRLELTNEFIKRSYPHMFDLTIILKDKCLTGAYGEVFHCQMQTILIRKTREILNLDLMCLLPNKYK